MTYEQAIEVMKLVSECFNDSPSQIKRAVRRIVRSENKKIQAITQEVLPAAAATTSSTSRKRIAELETTSSKKGKLDDRLMGMSQSLESQILYMHPEEIHPTSVDDAIFILQKRMDNALKRFKEEKERALIPSKDISTVQKHVQKNIEHYIQEIKQNEKAFNLIALDKTLDKWITFLPLIEWVNIHIPNVPDDTFEELLKLFIIQIDESIDFFSYAAPLLQGIKEHPAELHEILIKLTRQILREEEPNIERIQKYDYGSFNETFIDISPLLFEENKAVLEQFIYDMRVQQNKLHNVENAIIEEFQQRTPNINCKELDF